MLQGYLIPNISIPIRKYGEPYKNYNLRLLDFFYKYMKHFSVKETMFRNFWDVLKDDLIEDLNYKNLIRLLYKSNIKWTFLEYKGSRFNSITKKPPRKNMFILNKYSIPFFRTKMILSK